jgi:2-dehydropantoate 2-reductase
MRIAIFGTGGVGGYFGGRLAAAGGDVAFIARGAHLSAMRERGLLVESPLGNIRLPHINATDTPSAIGPVDIVLFTVKLYQTDQAVRQLAPLIGPKTLVVSLQNGVDSIDVLNRAVGREHVAGGTAYLAAVVTEPGMIRHTAMNRMIVGVSGGGSTPALDELVRMSKQAGIDAVLSQQIEVDIWAKFARLTVFSGMTAVTRCPIGPLRDDVALADMMRGALRESITVAKACGVPLTDALVDEVQVATAALPWNARSSMLEDLERGRPLELPWLSGAVARIGQEHGVDTPIHRFIATVLKPHVNGKKPDA